MSLGVPNLPPSSFAFADSIFAIVTETEEDCMNCENSKF